MSVTIRAVSHTDLEQYLPELTSLLLDTVNHGVPLGFLPPIPVQEATQYWLSLKGDLRSGSRLLLIATDEGKLVGSGQLWYTTVPNGRHRCEVQKLFVNSSIRGKGIGRALMEELHAVARRVGRPLVTLQTRRGLPAVKFYLDLGYKEAGVIPGYTIDAQGKRYDTVTFYLELPPTVNAIVGLKESSVVSRQS
jgi:ribosomal protein S18 acetylase RimI-like enzyme